ncbi:hypothetical protein DL96DRAFT_237050 [Flagelloscypha sp. PMI_526]|nr:hypothetical protein DL96DRAFT_237050 [Flagelloscypha sp. PMI_526]
MSELWVGAPHQGVQQDTEKKARKAINSRPICVLTLDGGIPGTTESSQLVIVKQLVYNLQFRLGEEDGGEHTKPRPCDVFDYIAGSGMGGVFAILFDSFEYHVEQALEFYCKLHERVFLSSHWKDKEKHEAKKILEETLFDLLPADILNSPFIKRNEGSKCRTLICTSNPHNNAHPRLFRTYASRQSTTPACTVLDALVLSIVDSDHLDPYSLGQPVEYFVGSGHRFSNPTAHALREISIMEGNDIPLSCIVSIGAGHPGALMAENSRAIISDCEREEDDLCRRCAGTEGLYFRLNVQQGLQFPTYGPSEVVTHTHQYLEGIGDTIDDLGENLLERPGRLSISTAVAFVQDISLSERKDMYKDVKSLKNIKTMSILELLEISNDAPYTSAAANKVQRRQCTVNTRVKIIQEIYSWAQNSGLSPVTSLFWIYGLAGTGKTTILQTLCEVLDNAGLLASSYFCSIQLDSKESKRIVPTIARHLARHNSMFSQHLASQLQAHPDCAYAQLPLQFRDLLCGPWNAAYLKETEHSQCVVAIDALDECDQGDEFLGLILDAINNGALQGLKFLVTSRPVPTIVERARTMQHGPQIALHEVSKEEVHDDIGRFLDEQLHGKLDPAQIRVLTDRSDGLFIFASTLVKHLLPFEDLSRSERTRLLEQILNPAHQGEKVGLDALYKHILNGALCSKQLGLEGFDRRLRILQTITSTAEPTSAQVVAKLVPGITVADVMRLVKSLHSVLFSATADGPIYVVHASFQEFVNSQSDGPFKSNVPYIHATLGQSCISYLQEGLRFNICDIKSSFTPDEDLDPPILTIGPLLAYACQHWWGHYKRCNRDKQKAMSSAIHRLIKEKGLFWIEAMSLLGHVRDCRDIFTEFASASTSLHLLSRSNSVQLLALEAGALITLFISMSPKITSQLYLSLLPLWEGQIFSCWRIGFQHVPQVISRRIDGVDSCQLCISTPSLVNSVVFSSDSKQIICGTSYNIVQILDAESGQELRQLIGHTEPVNCVASSPDGKQITSGSDDTTIRIWDASSGEQVRHLNGHTGSVQSVAFSIDSLQVVSSSADSTVRIWSANSGIQLYQLKGHPGGFQVTAFSPDGKRVASGSYDKIMIIWDIKSGKELRRLGPRDGCVRTIAFSPNGKRLASGSDDGTVRIWDIKSGKQLRQLDRGDLGNIYSVAFSPNGKRVACGSRKDCLIIWDAKSGKQLHQLHGHDQGIYSVNFSPDGKRIASGSLDKSMRIWNTKSGHQLQQLNGHSHFVDLVSFSSDGKHLASSASDAVRIWDAHSGVQLRQFYRHEYNKVQRAAFSPDGKRVASGYEDRTVGIWDAKSGKQLRKLSGHDSRVLAVSFSPHGERLISGSHDRTVRIWDANSGKQLCQLNGHTLEVMSVSFSPDGMKILSGSADKSMIVWDARSGNQLHRLNGHYGCILSAIFSPDGNQVASGSEQDKTVRIWDVTSGKQLHQLSGHRSSVRSVAFSPSGKLLASGSEDGTVRLWDAIFGKGLHNFDAKDPCVTSVAFSPDGYQIASGSWGGTIRIWNVEPSEFFCRIYGVVEPVTSVKFFPQDLPSLNTQATPNRSISRSLSLIPTTTSVFTYDDGWVVTSYERAGAEHKLLWLPPALRPFHPEVHHVMSKGGFNKIDLSGCIFGEGWSKIYRSGS